MQWMEHTSVRVSECPTFLSLQNFNFLPCLFFGGLLALSVLDKCCIANPIPRSSTTHSLSSFGATPESIIHQSPKPFQGFLSSSPPTIIDHSKSSFILIGANPPAVSPCTAFLQTLRGAFTPPYPPFLACLGFSFLAIDCFFVREDRLKSPGTTPSTIFSDSFDAAVVRPIFRALPRCLFLTAQKI